MTQIPPIKIITGVSIAASVLAMALLVPSVRQSIQKSFATEKREVLSTVSGDVTGEGMRQKIVKVKTHRGLFLEIYDVRKGQQPTMRESIRLRDVRDGHFMFNGESSNLVLDDINGDSVLEILAPSFDKNFAAHLNVFTYSSELNRFIEMN